MNEKEIRRVTDVETLKAVAHPLRVRLLGSLRVDGPATANELARRFGESSGATSYHLRQLARYGFVEEHPEQRNARERRWRAVHRYTAWRNSDFAKDPAGQEAARFMRRGQIEMLVRHFQDFESGGWPEGWTDAAGISDRHVRLTPASLDALWQRLSLLLDELAAPEGDADAENVAITVAAFPRRGYV